MTGQQGTPKISGCLPGETWRRLGQAQRGGLLFAAVQRVEARSCLRANRFRGFLLPLEWERRHGKSSLVMTEPH